MSTRRCTFEAVRAALSARSWSLDSGRGAGYSCGLFCGSGGVLLQNGKDSGAVKIVAQLAGGNGLRPVRRKVGQPPPALLDGHTLLQQQRGKLVKAGGGGKGFP